VFNFLGIVFCAVLLLLTGCSTPPGGAPESVPREWVSTNALPARPVVRPPVVRTNAAPQIIPKPAPVLTWTSLDRWARENQLAPPRKIASTPVASYAVNSPGGTLTLVIGSREAVWRGLEIQLGFAPEIVDDQVFVHGLDLQKSLAPLLLNRPLVLGTNRVIVIDPGHGGANVGTRSVLDGRFEKEFTLDWARRIEALLATNGWTVYLTRTNDTEMALSNRVAFAEARRADVFISLHFNSAAPDRWQGGVETYCLTPTGMPSSLIRGYSDYWSDRYPNNAFDEENFLLAVRFHAALLRVSGGEDRGVRRARFMGVLNGQKRPAVLLEAGYLSNPDEARKIETPGFRQKLAEAVAAALR
jgi:N-acetylmuramoyl-L-alanine amidase